MFTTLPFLSLSFFPCISVAENGEKKMTKREKRARKRDKQPMRRRKRRDGESPRQVEDKKKGAKPMCGHPGKQGKDREANDEKEETERVDRSRKRMHACMSMRYRWIESLRFGMRQGATNTRHPYRDWKQSCRFRDPETG